MKIELKHNDQTIGEILLTMASTSTKELKGLLIPSDNYFQIRSSINKYNEIFNTIKSNNIFDKLLDEKLRSKYDNLLKMYQNIHITIEQENITYNDSEIKIIDNLEQTGLGNHIIRIEAWNLKTEISLNKLKRYSMKYKYPSKPSHTLEIKHKGKKIKEY